jgi:hypothetical protein
MTKVSIVQLYLLRAVYLLIVVGLALQVWPSMVHRVAEMGLSQGTVTCMLWAMSVLAMLGIRHPLKMLPLIFFETVWKAAWLLTVALPKWSSGVPLDYWTRQSAIACLMGVIFPIVIPWRYVFEHYVKSPGDPWRKNYGDSALN